MELQVGNSYVNTPQEVRAVAKSYRGFSVAD